MKYLCALLIALVLNAAANLLMKIGMKSIASTGDVLSRGIGSAVATVASSAPILIGLTCFGFNAAFYMYALQSKTLKISLAYPVMVGGGFALIAVIARFHPFLNERLSSLQILGVVLILAGVILIATQTRSAVS